MLGAINPQAMRDRIITTATDPSKLQTFAAQTNQVIDPTKGSNFTDQKIDFYKMIVDVFDCWIIFVHVCNSSVYVNCLFK